MEQHWSVSCRVYSNLIRICNNDWARHWHISYHRQRESCEVFKFHSEKQVYQIEGLSQNGLNSLEITKINSQNQIFTFFQVTKIILHLKKVVIIWPSVIEFCSWCLYLLTRSLCTLSCVLAGSSTKDMNLVEASEPYVAERSASTRGVITIAVPGCNPANETVTCSENEHQIGIEHFDICGRLKNSHSVNNLHFGNDDNCHLKTELSSSSTTYL